MRPIYLDYAATTPVDKRVVAKMLQYLDVDGKFGNPSSGAHHYGWEAEDAVEAARRQVGRLIGCSPRDIIWTSGATEADNLAIIGAARAAASRGNHIITSSTEHKAVLDACKYLQKNGFDVTFLNPDASGIITPEMVLSVVRADTILLSIMHVNNETGVSQDIAALGALAKEHKIIFHVDAVQSMGKLPVDVDAMCIDLLSISAHKMYGPKGIGALFIRSQPEKVELQPLCFGGGQERGLRAGTLATHQIAGIGEAAEIARAEMAEETPRIQALRDQLWAGISSLPNVKLNGDLIRRSPGHLNISFEGVCGETLISALTNIAVSSGSACNSANAEPSHVLRAMGVCNALAHATLRFSLGRYTTEEEIEKTIAHVNQVIRSL